MRNKEEEGIPLVNIERNPLVIAVSIVVTVFTVYFTYRLFLHMNPWGFILLTPAVVLLFQTLWMILNPFAIIFEDKLEIKQSFFQHKDRYFIDIKRIARNKAGRLYITYHDDEIEHLNLFGIRGTQVELLKSEIEKVIVKP